MTETHDPVPGATHSVPDARGYKWKNIGTRISEARTEGGIYAASVERASGSQLPNGLVLGGGKDEAHLTNDSWNWRINAR